MTLSDTDNKDEVTVGTRLRRYEKSLLDAACEKAGDPNRAATIRRLIRCEIELHFPGSLDRAA